MRGEFQVSEEVRGVLRESTVAQGTTCWTLALPRRQLDRKLYLEVDKVLKAAGGTWSRKARVHLFDRDPQPLLGLAVETGRAVDPKKRRQAFYTPRQVADQLVALIDDPADDPPGQSLGGWNGKRVLEPSAGEGALLEALHEVGVWRHLMTPIEQDPEACNVLLRLGYMPHCADFLSLDPAAFEPFDRVIMNPPFADRADVLHVRHALRFLRPGGILVSVLPMGIKTRIDRLTRDFRAQVADWCEWHDLPAGAFHESGTEVATTILKVRN